MSRTGSEPSLADKLSSRPNRHGNFAEFIDRNFMSTDDIGEPDQKGIVLPAQNLISPKFLQDLEANPCPKACPKIILPDQTPRATKSRVFTPKRSATDNATPMSLLRNNTLNRFGTGESLTVRARSETRQGETSLANNSKIVSFHGKKYHSDIGYSLAGIKDTEPSPGLKNGVKSRLTLTLTTLFQPKKESNKNVKSLVKLPQKQYELINDKAFVSENTSPKLASKGRAKQVPRLKLLLQKHKIVRQDVQADFVKRIMAKVRQNKKSFGAKTLGEIKKLHEKVQEFFGNFGQTLKNLLLPVRPEGKFKAFWDAICSCFVIYEVLFIPFQIGFEYEGGQSLQNFELIKEIFFFLDILLMFHTSFVHEGTVILEHKKIAIYYLKHWFFSDLLASLPYRAILDHLRDTSQVSFKYLRIVTLLGFLRLVRLGNIFRKLKDDMHSQTISTIISLLKLLAFISFLAHIVACVWHFTGIILLDSGSISWISKSGFLDQSTVERYIASLYWTILTMMTVGYGDITPATMVERILNIFVMLLGCGVFGYSMNSIGILLQNINAEVSQKRQKYYVINKFMSRKTLSKDTQERVQHYLDYLFETQNEGKAEEEAILAMLSDGIQEQVRKEINGRVLKENILFQSVFGTKFLSMLSNYLEEKIYSPSEKIYDEHDKLFSVFFISSGCVDLCFGESKQKVLRFQKGQHFGELAFFTNRSRQFSAFSSSFTSIFFLKKQQFLDIVEDYQVEKEIFHQVKDKVVFYSDYHDLRLTCSSCEKEDHHITECPILHYVPNKIEIIQAAINEEKEFCRSFQRINRTRYHARVQAQETEYKGLVVHKKKLVEKMSLLPQRESQEFIEFSEPPDDNENYDSQNSFKTKDMVTRRLSKYKTNKDCTVNPMSELEFPGMSLGDTNTYIIGMPYGRVSVSGSMSEIDNPVFDRVMNYQIYFPHNNLSKIIENMSQQAIKRKKLKRIQNQIQDLKEDVEKLAGYGSPYFTGVTPKSIATKSKYWGFLFGEEFERQRSPISRQNKMVISPFRPDGRTPRNQDLKRRKIQLSFDAPDKNQ